MNPGEPPLKMGTRSHIPECWGQIVQPSTLNLMLIRGWVRQLCQPKAVYLRPNGNRGEPKPMKGLWDGSTYCHRHYTELPVSGDNKKQASFELVLLLFSNSLQVALSFLGPLGKMPPTPHSAPLPTHTTPGTTKEWSVQLGTTCRTLRGSHFFFFFFFFKLNLIGVSLLYRALTRAPAAVL